MLYRHICFFTLVILVLAVVAGVYIAHIKRPPYYSYDTSLEFNPEEK